jgi:site-specific DNA recombinase
MTPRRKIADGRLRSVGYARVSTEEQGREGVSLAAQREKIAGFCTARGWDLIRIYTDTASGKDMKRPGLQKMLGDARQGEFEAVVIVKLDRLSRRVFDWGRLQEEMHQRGIALVSIGESLDDTTAVGRMMGNIIAAFAQMERELIGERTKTALDHKKAHLQTYGPTPYGFRRRGDRLVPDGKTLSVVQDIFTCRKANATLREIATALMEQRIPSPQGRPEWSAETVRIILRNAALYGHVMNGLLEGK